MNSEGSGGKSYLQLALEKLASICNAFSLGQERFDEMSEIVRLMMSSWGDGETGSRPRLLSDITDDHTPFEFSLTFREGEDEPEVRFLVEALPDDPLISSRWEAGLQLNRVLEKHCGCSLKRFREIEDLYRPTDEWARFAIWHAVNMGKRASFKIYLNPNAHGTERAADILAETFQRLGLEESLNTLPSHRLVTDEVRYFSLDLNADSEARIKVYFAHRNLSSEDLETRMQVARSHRLGDTVDFCRSVAGGAVRFRQMALQTCFAFVGSSLVPETATLHFPVRAYANHDGEILGRVIGLLGPEHQPCYERMLKNFMGRSPSDALGFQSYVSFRRQRGRKNLTVYLSPNAYKPLPAVFTQRRPALHVATG